jgi:hypothetical protein
MLHCIYLLVCVGAGVFARGNGPHQQQGSACFCEGLSVSSSCFVLSFVLLLCVLSISCLQDAEELRREKYAVQQAAKVCLLHCAVDVSYRVGWIVKSVHGTRCCLCVDLLCATLLREPFQQAKEQPAKEKKAGKGSSSCFTRTNNDDRLLSMHVFLTLTLSARREEAGGRRRCSRQGISLTHPLKSCDDVDLM